MANFIFSFGILHNSYSYADKIYLICEYFQCYDDKIWIFSLVSVYFIVSIDKHKYINHIDDIRGIIGVTI